LLVALTEILEGHADITGSVLSATITLKVQVDELPAASVAVYFTCVVPTGKVAPGLCVLTKLAMLQLSDAVGGVQLAVAVHDELPAVTLIVPGQPEITGSCVSSPEALQQTATPARLVAAITLKDPNVSPT
jgi:hypothetical protein